MTATEAAYLAGLIDGEGSVILYMRRDSVAMLVTVTNTSRRMLDWIREATQVGAVCDQAKESLIRKATWFWRCNADAAVSVLEQIQPYLVVKREQCDLALETQRRLRDPALKADRSWHDEWRMKMRTLNRRGPAVPT